LTFRPQQGLAEVAVNDLENILQGEISRIRSKGLIDVASRTGFQIDHSSKSLTLCGKHLQVGDTILLQADSEGQSCDLQFLWKVVQLKYKKSLNCEDLQVGEIYSICSDPDHETQPFRLVEADLGKNSYHFEPLADDIDDLLVCSDKLLSIYPFKENNEGNSQIDKVIIQCITKNQRDRHTQAELIMSKIWDRVFSLVMDSSHIYDTRRYVSYFCSLQVCNLPNARF
jgi:hypothetical protein